MESCFGLPLNFGSGNNIDFAANREIGAPTPFIWKQCSPPDGPMNVANLSIAPMPVVISKTKDTTIKVAVVGQLSASVGERD